MGLARLTKTEEVLALWVEHPRRQAEECRKGEVEMMDPRDVRNAAAAMFMMSTVLVCAWGQLTASPMDVDGPVFEGFSMSLPVQLTGAGKSMLYPRATMPEPLERDYRLEELYREQIEALARQLREMKAKAAVLEAMMSEECGCDQQFLTATLEAHMAQLLATGQEIKGIELDVPNCSFAIVVEVELSDLPSAPAPSFAPARDPPSTDI